MRGHIKYDGERYINAVYKTFKMGNVIERYWDIDYPVRDSGSNEIAEDFVAVDVADTVVEAIATCKDAQQRLVQNTNCFFNIKFIYQELVYVEPLDDEILELMLLLS